MKGWWVRYKFCNLARRWRILDGRRARTAGCGDWVFWNPPVTNRPNYLRGLLKGLSRRRPASPQKTKSRAEPGANRPSRGRNPAHTQTEDLQTHYAWLFALLSSLIAPRSV